MDPTHARHIAWLLGGALAVAATSCRSRDLGPSRDGERAPATTAATGPATGEATPEATPDPAARRPATPDPAFADIAADLAPLRARFQQDDGLVRVIMLVAPT